MGNILGLFALGFEGFKKRGCLRFEIGHEGSLIPTQSVDAPMHLARIELLIRLCYYVHVRGVAQPGSVLDWGSSGREFKSRHLDQKNTVRDEEFKNLVPSLSPDFAV